MTERISCYNRRHRINRWIRVSSARTRILIGLAVAGAMLRWDGVALAAVQARRPTLEVVRGRGRVRTALALFGPAMVASVAYVDPGNFATNLAGGAQHGYELVRVIVMAK